MKKVILKYKDRLKPDDIDRIAEAIYKDIEKLGFAVIDDRFDVIEIEEKE